MIPAGKIGEPKGTLGKIRGITTPPNNPITGKHNFAIVSTHPKG